MGSGNPRPAASVKSQDAIGDQIAGRLSGQIAGRLSGQIAGRP
jgi:hypothetical protein